MIRNVHARVLAVLMTALLSFASLGSTAFAQGLDVKNRPVNDIRIEGLKQVQERLIRNSIRIHAGEAYDPEVVKEDIVRITHLGRFSSVTARVEPQADGGITLIYVVAEQPLLSDVSFVGNKELSDQELGHLVVLKAGDPIDPFLIERGAQEIRRAYAKAGYFVTDVSIDQQTLDESAILVYRVREGPKPKIYEIDFEGNKAFTEDQLYSKIKSKKHIFILRKGELNREQLDGDEALVREFYQANGYLEAQVGRRIDLGPDQKTALIKFVIQEGPRFTVDTIKFEGNEIFSDAQLLESMTLKPGDVFSEESRRRSEQEIASKYYAKLGFITTESRIERLFHENEPKVDLVVRIVHKLDADKIASGEGNPYRVGKVSIQGNELTKDHVILQQMRGLWPGERYDGEGIKRTERRLTQSALFSEGKLTVLGDLDETSRDLSLTMKEKSTASLSFGAGISSDSGVMGAVDLVQRNFDIADLPESPSEFFTGKAFRGAGQYFALSLQPGLETSRYSISFREPYLLGSDYFLDTSIFYFTRERDQYDEERVGGAIGLGQRFGDIWSVAVRARGEQVLIDNIEDDAPVDVFAVEGHSVITSLGLVLSRNTTDDRIFPTQGSKWDIGVSRAGALGGDYDFTAVSTDFRKFWTVEEDFFGRRTVLSMRNEIGFIFEDPEEVPMFERFYAGGGRSFRGFDYRGVGPRGIRADNGRVGDDPVGGQWMFLLGFEYNIPVYEEIIRIVFFTDTGTVQEDIGFDEYRVSVGTGVRIKIPFLGQAPFALDFAYPLIKEDGDEVQYISFELAVPF